MEDVSLLMTRQAERVSFPDDESRETVTSLMSLGSVLVNFKVAELFCEAVWAMQLSAQGSMRGHGG